MSAKTEAPWQVSIKSYFKGLSIPYWKRLKYLECTKGRKKLKLKSTHYQETLDQLDEIRNSTHDQLPTWIELQGYGVALGLFKHFLSELNYEFR